MYATSIAASAPYHIIYGSKSTGTSSLRGLGTMIGIGSSLKEEWTAHWVLAGIGLLFLIGTLIVGFFICRKQAMEYLPESSTTALART